MTFVYQPNPHAIEQDSFRQIRQLTDLSGLSTDAQQVVMRVVHSVGDPLVAQHMRISANACAAGRGALAKHASPLVGHRHLGLISPLINEFGESYLAL